MFLLSLGRHKVTGNTEGRRLHSSEGSAGVVGAGRGEHGPAPQSPGATETCAGRQSLLRSVRNAPAKSVQVTALTGPIHVREKYFLAPFPFLSQRHQQQSKLDWAGSCAATPAGADPFRGAEGVHSPGHRQSASPRQNAFGRTCFWGSTQCPVGLTLFPPVCI